jgi:TolA-binding protein
MSNKAATGAYARQVTVATMRVAQLEAALVDAEARVGQLEEALRAQVEEDYTKLETLEEVNAEVSRIRGEIEVLQFELAETSRSLEGLTVDQERRMLHGERRLAQLERFLGVQPPPPPTDEELGVVSMDDDGAEEAPVVEEGLPPDLEGEPDTEPVEEEPPTPEDVQGILEMAVAHMEAGRHQVARALLEKAVAEHQGAPEMDEVRYRIAETYFNEEQWSRAISEYNKVIEGWSQSVWAPWAMLSQGDAFEAWGQPDNAKLFYEEVVRVYPQSDAAKEAKKLLAER